MLSKFELADCYSVIVLDLDNTLYNEQDYLFSGYKKIAEYVSNQNNGLVFEHYYNYLTTNFLTTGRHNLFDRFIEHYNLSVKVSELVEILHTQQADIHFCEKGKNLLKLLIGYNKSIYILTNGNIIQQQNKVKLLGINEFYPSIKIVYASMYEPKPSPVTLIKIMIEEHVSKDDVLFIGDSKTDEDTARNANVDYIDIQNIQL